MFRGLIIFINSFILYGTVILFMDIVKDIPNIHKWTQDERIGFYILLIGVPLIAAINIESIIGAARKIWSSRR